MMRVLANDKPHDALTPAQERNISLWTVKDMGESSMLSAEEATVAYLGQIKWAFGISGCLFILLTAGIALAAKPSETSFAYGAIIVLDLSAVAALLFFLRRRKRLWNEQMGLRLMGLAPAGSRIAFDAAALHVGGEALPWLSLQIDQVDFTRFTNRRAEFFIIKRLSLTSPVGPVVLDPVMMRNGRMIVDNVWRRLRKSAAPQAQSL
jgi:hypothetical protein